VLNAKPAKGGPSLLRRMERTVGPEAAGAVWVESVRHVLEAAGISRNVGISGKYTAEQLVYGAMNNLSTAYYGINFSTARSQFLGVFAKLSDPSSPTSVGDFLVGALDAARHPVKFWRELADLSPLVRHRVSQALNLAMFGDDRGVQGGRGLWWHARWWRRIRAQVQDKLFFAKHTDAFTQIMRYRINYAYGIRRGLSPEKARAQAARMTEVDIENQDFPAHAGSADMASQRARRGIFRKLAVWAGQSRSSHTNIFIRNWNQFRRDKDVRKFAKGLIGLLLTTIGISASNILKWSAYREALRDPAEATKAFVFEVLGNLFGNIHGVRQLAQAVRYPYGGIEVSPLLGTIEEIIKAAHGLYGAIDDWDDEKAWNAACSLTYSMSILAGIPVVGPHSMYRIVRGLATEQKRTGQKRRAGRKRRMP